jgi:hypothetical protein
VWAMTRSKNMETLGLCDTFPTAQDSPDFKSSQYKEVDWDGAEVIPIAEGQPCLVTRDVGPCYALCVRGYNEAGLLTHIGMAHWFVERETVSSLFEKMRNAVGEGRIELFIAGGGDPARNQTISTYARVKNIELVQDLSCHFSKRFNLLSTEGDLYTGSMKIKSVCFNQGGQPSFEIDAYLYITEQFNKFLEDPSQIKTRLFKQGEPNYQALMQTQAVSSASYVPTM